MNFAPLKHALYRALGTRDALYLDTNAWSELAKGNVDDRALADWLERTNSVVAISRFSIGELTRDEWLASRLSELIAALNAIFVDLGTNDLNGIPWQQVPYEKLSPLRPADSAAMDALVDLLRSKQIRETMNAIQLDSAIWQNRLERLTAQKPKWSWTDFDAQLHEFIRETCIGNGREVNDEGLNDSRIYVGVKLSFGVAFQRYFLNRQAYKPSDYVDYLHCSDMPYFKTVVTERGTCNAIREVQRRIPGVGPYEVHNLKWFEDIQKSA